MNSFKLVLCRELTPLSVTAEGAGLKRGVTSFKNSTLHSSNRYSATADGYRGCVTWSTTEINNGTGTILFKPKRRPQNKLKRRSGYLKRE